MTVRRVPAAEVLADWPYYRERLNSVMERTDAEMRTDDVLTCLQTGDMQMWRSLEGDGIGVTQLQTFPRYKQLLLYAVAGENSQDWLDAGDQQLEAFALSHGCTRMVFHGRIGWDRLVRKYGYDIRLYVMKKVIGDGRRQQSAADDEI